MAKVMILRVKNWQVWNEVTVKVNDQDADERSEEDGSKVGVMHNEMSDL